MSHPSSLFFFSNDPAPTEIYTLSLHDALPIFGAQDSPLAIGAAGVVLDYLKQNQARVVPGSFSVRTYSPEDRKSTRLNSSHVEISYAVFCLKKKKKTHQNINLKQKSTKSFQNI